jgi:cell division septation protein DedD
MWGAIDKKGVDSPQPQLDADLTLGPAMLLGILLALLVTGALVFGAGYYIGRHGSQGMLEAVKPAPDAQVPVQAGCVQAKPSASAQMDLAPDLDSAGADQAGNLPASGASSTNAAGSASNAAAATTSGALSSQLQVRPALDPAASSLQTAASLGGAMNETPAIPSPAVAPVVQIAAVSHQEDADVLLNALRKRGYPVSARRELTDNLIHVRIGPFKTRDEANKWSQKLMNDGYNAIVQP